MNSKSQHKLNSKYQIGINEIHFDLSSLRSFFIILPIVISTILVLPAQSSKLELESKRKQLLKSINRTTEALKQTKNQKKSTIEAFSSLENRIQDRKELVKNLEAEIEIVDFAIQEVTNKINLLEIDLKNLGLEYKSLLNKAYRIKRQNTWVVFLFSANGLNDAFKRWRYIQQFEAYRKRQINQLLDVKTNLEIEQLDLERQRSEKEYLLRTQEDQNQILYEEFDRKNSLLTQLNRKEQQLIKELDAQNKAKAELSAAIENFIQSQTGGNTSGNLTNAGRRLTSRNYDPESKRFFDKKGRHNWPVKNGLVTRFFGKQSHPIVKSIQVTNNGIDIKVRASDLNVYAVENGEIIMTPSIPGLKESALIKHGVFFTVYSNISQLRVEVGQKVNAGTIIGVLDKNNPELHFELWENKGILNPLNWLRR